MKRFLALFLVCCLIVSALSVPAFAADSIVGRKWSCSTTGKTITVGSSDSLSYVFDASLGMNGFGSSPIENIYSSFPGWSGIKRSTSSLYTLPAGSTISYSVTISVSGFSGFGSSDLKPLGHISVCSVTDSGGWQSSVASSSSITPVISSGAYLYSFSGTVTLKDYVKTYAASLFFVFNLTGRTNNPINGKRLTCTVSSSDIFVKYLAGASSASEDQINSTVNNIYNTVINNNTEVIAQITNVIGVLNNLFQNTVQINTYLESLVGEINAMGSDLDSVLSYLQQIVTTLNYLPRIYDKLDSIGLSSETIQALIDGISSSISPSAADLSNVEEYLSNTLNQINHISDIVDAISEKLDISNGWFEQFAGHLVKINTDVGLCSSYLQGIYNTLSNFVLDDTAAMRQYLKESNTNILSILEEIRALHDSLGDEAGAQLDEIIKNLVSQGTSIDGIKSFVSTIKQNTTESVKLLGDILEELKKVEAENAETNDRLKGIQDAIDGFEINVSNAADKVLTGGDQKGLGALVSKLINHLLSIVDFVTDLFGGIFTSIPSTISAYNDCNTFWGDQKTYIYTPHQLSGYTGQGGNSYENSNDSVQKLFAEAEKYLGYPYVFGGSSPETSFDCSGFVCYALNHSGVYSIGRTTAQGLYDACTPVDRFDAKPGDLVFFTGTYDCADTVSHVGIYAGDGKMLHCGDPIQYTSIDTSYWQAHFYAFGRLSYNVDLVRPYFVSLHSSSSWDREWSNIYEVYVTDSDGSSINFSMNRDMAVITICQYDYSDSKWWAYTSVSASDNYTLSTASLPVRQYNSEGKPYLICAYIKDSDGVLVCSKPIAVIDPRYYSGTFSQLKFVQTYSCFPGSNIWPSTFYGGVNSE